MIEDGYQKRQIKTWVYDDVVNQFMQWAKMDDIKLYLIGELPKLVAKMAMEDSIKGNLDLLVESYFDRDIEGSTTIPSTFKKLFENKKIPFPLEEVVFVSHSISQVVDQWLHY